MTKAKETNNKIYELLELAEEEKSNGNYKEAINYAEQALSVDPLCIDALEEICDNSLCIGDYEKAKNASNFLLTISKSYVAYYVLGYIAFKEKDYKESIKNLEKGNKSNPHNSEMLRALGKAYFFDGRTLLGIVSLERALNLNQNSEFILRDLGYCYMKSGNLETIDKALELLYRALEIDPSDKTIKEYIKEAEAIIDNKNKDDKRVKKEIKKKIF